MAKITGHKVNALKRKAEKAKRSYDAEVRDGTYSDKAFRAMEKAQTAYNDARAEYDYQKSKRNPAATSGYVKCKAVKIVRNKAGKAVAVRIKT